MAKQVNDIKLEECSGEGETIGDRMFDVSVQYSPRDTHSLLVPADSSSSARVASLSLSLLHLLLISLPHSFASPGYFAPCAPEAVLFPCRCHHHERIECTDSLRYHLPSVFTSLVSSLAPAHPRPLYHEFYLSNARLTELDNNFLATTRFERISLVDMSSLVKIEAGAFAGTEEDVLYFAIKGKSLQPGGELI